MHKTMNMLLILIAMISTGSCSYKDKDTNTKSESSQIVDIDIEKGLKQEIGVLNLSDAVSSLEIVPLEFTDKSAIKDIYNIGITENDIVTTSYRQLLHFSKDGKFLNEIGRFGNGPEEYSNTYYCMIRGNHKDVYILTGQGVKAFNFDGRFKREASKQKYADMFSGFESKPLYFSNHFFLHDKLPLDSPKNDFWSLALVDSAFNIQKKFYNPDYIDRYPDMLKEENRLNHSYLKNHWAEHFLNDSYYDNTFKIKYYGVDTIYQFNDEKLRFDPIYSLSFGERPAFEMAHSWIKEPAFFKYLWVYDFYEVKDFIYFLAGKGDVVYTIRYNKRNREIKVRKDKSKIRETLFPGTNLTYRRLNREFKLTNDISGGVDFVVDYKTPEGYWVSVCQPSDLLKKINIEELKKSEVKDRAARDKLVKILTNLSEDDNPVLFIAKLK